MNKKMDIMWRYVILAYGLFWLLVLGVCGTASLIFHASPLTMSILSDITAWSPTFAVLILFKKLKPNMHLKDFIKNCFKGKLKVSGFFFSGLAMISGTLITVLILSFIEHKSFSTYFSLGNYSILASIFLSLCSGPTGEELGWRGYLRPELNNKFGFLKGTFIQGFIWAFWHTILWFIDSDFHDYRMILYIISNVVVMTAITFIINIVLEKYDNLLYAMWIHFCFNLPYSFLRVDIAYYMIMCIIFPLIAFCFYHYHKMQKAKTVS